MSLDEKSFYRAGASFWKDSSTVSCTQPKLVTNSSSLSLHKSSASEITGLSNPDTNECKDILDRIDILIDQSNVTIPMDAIELSQVINDEVYSFQ